MIDREWIEDFVELHRIQLVVSLSAVLAILALIIVLSLASGGHQGKHKKLKQSPGGNVTIKAGDFWLPSEPLQVPGIQLFREPTSKWSPAEIKRWYTVPDTEALGELRSAGKKTVDEILESVP